MNDEIIHGESPLVNIQATCCLALTRQWKRITQCIQRGPNRARGCRKLNLTFGHRPAPSMSHLTLSLELEQFTRYRKKRFRQSNSLRIDRNHRLQGGRTGKMLR